MKNVQKIDLGLTGYDELFMNDAERKENKLPRIYDVPISEIDDFPDHPFKVKVDEDMDQLVQSITGVKRPFIVKWQITNTGEEARQAGCLRGNFENSDIGEMGKRESTSYSGSHSVQCFIIKKGICVAKSKDFIINIK